MIVHAPCTNILECKTPALSLQKTMAGVKNVFLLARAAFFDARAWVYMVRRVYVARGPVRLRIVVDKGYRLSRLNRERLRLKAVFCHMDHFNAMCIDSGRHKEEADQ